MKPTFVLALLVAAFAAVSVDASCTSTCKARVMSFMEGECASWRNRLPRPDLYSRCQDGYALGRVAGCDEYCSAEPNEGKVSSLRLDACSSLRGHLPSELMTACQSGFSLASKRAKTLAVHDPKENVAEAETTADNAPVKKIQINKLTTAKNVLELAREEAAAAFQDNHASEL